MSEIPSKNYKNSGLYINANETNPWLVANSYYVDCITRFVYNFNTKNECLIELERSDVNKICKKELNYLREIAPDVRYKEMLGSQSILYQSPFIEEVLVKNRK